MVLNCKVSCEVNLSRNNKGRKYKEDDEKVVDMKLFTCQYCSYTSNRSYNVRTHEGRKHKNEILTIKKEYNENEVLPMETVGNKTVRDENKYIESILNRVKTDFERKRELGKIAMEMICKYELNVQGMPQEVKNAIKFHLKMEGSC